MELTPNMVLMNQSYNTKEEAIYAAGELLLKAGCVDAGYLDAMQEREKIVSTYAGNFVAIPHGTDEAKENIHKSGISVIQVPQGVSFGTTEDGDEQCVTVLFGIAGIGDEHMDILQEIAIFCSQLENVAKLADALTEEELIGFLKERNK